MLNARFEMQLSFISKGCEKMEYSFHRFPAKSSTSKSLRNSVRADAPRVRRASQLDRSASQQTVLRIAAHYTVLFAIHACVVMLPAVSFYKMNTATKMLRAMRSNPLDWDLAHLQTVARQNDVYWRHEGTSHCVFVRNDGKTLSVPARRPIKPI